MRVYRKIRSFQQSRTLLHTHCCRFWQNVAGFGNNVERNYVLSKKSKPLVSTLSKVRNFVRRCCRKGNIVAKNGNNVEATFDFVERIVQFVAFDNVASTLWLVWTGLLQSCLLLQQCCWCGRTGL